jgi:hypothetical protein
MSKRSRSSSFEVFFMGGPRDGTVCAFPGANDKLPDFFDAVTIVRGEDGKKVRTKPVPVYQRDGVHTDDKGNMWPLYRYIGPEPEGPPPAGKDAQVDAELREIIETETEG